MTLKLYRRSRNVKSIKVRPDKIKCVGKSVIKTYRPGSFRQLCCITRPGEKKEEEKNKPVSQTLSVREKRLNISAAFSSSLLVFFFNYIPKNKHTYTLKN